MRLGELVSGGGQAVVTGFAIDHRKVAPGTIFGAFPGARVNGEDFIPAAIAAGAIAIVSQPGVAVDGAVHITGDPARAVFARLAARYYAPVSSDRRRGYRHQWQDIDGGTDPAIVAPRRACCRQHRHAGGDDIARPGVDGADDARCRDFPGQHGRLAARRHYPCQLRSLQPWSRPVPHRRPAGARRGLHQPVARPSRLSWHDGGLFRGQAAAVHRCRRWRWRGGGLGR